MSEQQDKQISQDLEGLEAEEREFKNSIKAISPEMKAPAWVSRKMRSVSPKLNKLSEKALRRAVSPTLQDESLRIRFWIEYDCAVEQGRKMIMENVFSGTCSKGKFIQVLDNPTKCAWIFRPSSNYKNTMEALGVKATQRLDEVLDMDLHKVDASGETVPNTQLIGQILRIFEMVDNRNRGMAVQKIEEKKLTVSLSDKKYSPTNVKLLQERLKELKEDVARDSHEKFHNEEVIDVQ